MTSKRTATTERQMRFGNCLVCAVATWLAHPRSTRLVLRRNRFGRWHVLWRRDGVLFEFHAPGRAAKGYLRNLCYRGAARMLAMDP